MVLYKYSLRNSRFRFILEGGALKESIVVLLISSVTAVVAGLFLGKSKELLLLLPGLLILLPGAIDMRGSIFAALGSRLSSCMHLGLITNFNLKNSIIRDGIYSSLSLSLVSSIFLGILAKVFSVIAGIESISVYSFIFISVFAGILSGLILLVITIVISFRAFKMGWDPDNVTAPLIATLGDFFTIPSLLFAANIVGSLDAYIGYIAFFVIMVAILDFNAVMRRESGYKKIIKQSFPVLAASAVLSTLSGVLIEPNTVTFVTYASLLVLLPAFIGQCGNIGSILDSRLSTKMHLGTIRPGAGVSKTLKEEIISSYYLCFFIFPSIAVISYVLSVLSGISTIGFLEMFMMTTFAGFAVVTFIIAISYILSALAFRFNLDPDNLMIPIITPISDIIGIIFFIAAMMAFGIV